MIVLRSEGPLAETVAVIDGVKNRVRDIAILAWLQNPWILVLLVMAGALPLIYPTIPPLIDLGGHLGRFAVQIDGGDSISLRQWYSFTWDLIPNLGTDLLVHLLAPLMGLEPALKLIVISIVLLQIAGYILLARVAHGHVPPTVLFALPLSYGFPFQYGFLNFTLSIALATCALALWIALGNRDHAVLRWPIFLFIACVLWVCHLVGWAVFCVFAGAEELTRRYAKAGTPYRAALQSVLPLSCLLAPWVISFFWPSAPSGHGETTELFEFPMKVIYLGRVLLDRWIVWDLSSAILLLGLIQWTLRSGLFRLHAGLALGTVVLFVMYLLMPGVIMGSHLADMRLAPTILALTLISTRPRETVPRHLLTRLAMIGLLFAGARFVGNGISLAMLDHQFSQDLAALDAVPRNSNLVTLTVQPCLKSKPWALDRREHLAGFALARRHAFANDQWTIPGGQLLQVHNPDAEPFDRDPSQFTQPTACDGQPAVEQAVARVPLTVDHLWVVGSSRPLPFDGWIEVRRSGTSTVYSRKLAGQ